MATSGIPVLDMAANTADLGKLIAAEISRTMADYGLEMPELLHREHLAAAGGREGARQAHLDGRGRRPGPVHPVLGGRGDDPRRRQSRRRRRRAWPPGWGRHGHGDGRPMAARQGPWGAARRPQPRRRHRRRRSSMSGTSPRPAQTRGPFCKAAHGPDGHRRRLTRETLVWTAGQDGWKRADEVTELAQLFTVLPPPPPGRNEAGGRRTPDVHRGGRTNGARHRRDPARGRDDRSRRPRHRPRSRSTASPAPPAAPTCASTPRARQLVCDHCGHVEPIEGRAAARRGHSSSSTSSAPLDAARARGGDRGDAHRPLPELRRRGRVRARHCTPPSARSAPRPSSPTPAQPPHQAARAVLPFALTEEAARAAR